MVYFLYGSNLYLIKAKVDAVKQKFLLSDPSGLNMSEIDGSTLDLSIFQSNVFSTPFLTDKRLIIIKNFLLSNSDNELKKKIAEILPKVPPSSVVFFVDYGSPDARGALFKALNKKGVVQKFESLERLEFRRWALEQLSLYGVEMKPEAIDELDFFVGSDLWRAENEIQKLALYRKSLAKPGETVIITKEDISLLVSPQIQSNIFDFIDALSNKNGHVAALAIHKLLSDGKNELYILTMIVYQFRNMLIVADLQGKKMSQPEIAKKAKLHPFVVQKTSATLNKYSKGRIEEIYLLLSEIDFNIKSGQIDSNLALWILIEKICN